MPAVNQDTDFLEWLDSPAFYDLAVAHREAPPSPAERLTAFGKLRTAIRERYLEDVGRPHLRAKGDRPPCDHKFVDSLRCLKCGWQSPRRGAS